MVMRLLALAIGMIFVMCDVWDVCGMCVGCVWDAQDRETLLGPGQMITHTELYC